MGEEASVSVLRGVTHREVSLKIDLNNLKLLTNHISGLEITRDIARLASLGLPHAGDWLNVVPSPSLGLHLCPPEFIVSDYAWTSCPLMASVLLVLFLVIPEVIIQYRVDMKEKGCANIPLP